MFEISRNRMPQDSAGYIYIYITSSANNMLLPLSRDPRLGSLLSPWDSAESSVSASCGLVADMINQLFGDETLANRLPWVLGVDASISRSPRTSTWSPIQETILQTNADIENRHKSPFVDHVFWEPIGFPQLS